MCYEILGNSDEVFFPEKIEPGKRRASNYQFVEVWEKQNPRCKELYRPNDLVFSISQTQGRNRERVEIRRCQPNATPVACVHSVVGKLDLDGAAGKMKTLMASRWAHGLLPDP